MEGKPQAMSSLTGRASLYVALLLMISCLAPSAGSGANPTKVKYDVTVIGDFSAPLPLEATGATRGVEPMGSMRRATLLVGRTTFRRIPRCPHCSSSIRMAS